MERPNNNYQSALNPIKVYKQVLDGNLARFPNKFWVGEDALGRAAEITIYLIEDVLELSEDDLKAKMGIRLFQDNKLHGMINSLFEGSPYKAIENAYPGKYKALDFASVTRNYWNDESVKNASQWIAENGVRKSLQTTKKILRLSQSSMERKGLIRKITPR